MTDQARIKAILSDIRFCPRERAFVRLEDVRWLCSLIEHLESEVVRLRVVLIGMGCVDNAATIKRVDNRKIQSY